MHYSNGGDVKFKALFTEGPGRALFVEGTLLFSKGADPRAVQEMLGHSSVAITMDRYTHWIPSMGEQAAKMLGAAISLP